MIVTVMLAITLLCCTAAVAPEVGPLLWELAALTMQTP